MTKHRGKRGPVVKEKGLAGANGGWHRVNMNDEGGEVGSEGHREAKLGAQIHIQCSDFGHGMLGTGFQEDFSAS